MKKRTAADRIVDVLEVEPWLPVHAIAERLKDVSACSVSARFRDVLKGVVQKRKAIGKSYDEWALVKSRDQEDFI